MSCINGDLSTLTEGAIWKDRGINCHLHSKTPKNYLEIPDNKYFNCYVYAMQGVFTW